MATLNVTCFGSPRIELNGDAVELETRKALALLIYLLLNRRPQQREKLVGMFWPESPAKNAFASLRRTVWALKHTLGEEWFDFHRHALACHMPPDLVCDVLEFQQQLAVAAGHSHESNTACANCISALCRAVDLYTDDFLRGFTLADCQEFDDWQFFQTDLLRGALADAIQRVVTYYADHNDLPHAIQYAKLRIAGNAWDEAAHRELMRLYALNGQRSAALQQYQECVRVLEQELRIEPEPQTTALFEAISHQPETVLTPGHPAQLSLSESISLSAPLPLYQATPFIGRQQELDEIVETLHQPGCRLLTLVGLGGIGKTRLAQQLISRMRAEYADGVYFVALTAIPSADFLVPTLAETFQFSPSPGEEYQQAFQHFLSKKRLLLILDNFEHVLDGAGILRNILQHAPDIQAVVTSRELLELEEEWVYAVPGLSFPANMPENVEQHSLLHRYDAVQLFVQSAHRIHAAFALSDQNLAHIVRLCQRVDGLPLALELAASWCKMLSCRQIVAEIEQSFDLLTSRHTDRDPRHQSIRVVFESIWNQLAVDDQQRLCQLAVFQGSFDANAARVVADLSLPHLAEFMNRSLIKGDADGRFTLHPLLRRFLSEHLQAEPARHAAALRAFHAHYRQLLETYGQHLHTDQQREALHALLHELPNIRAVWQAAIEKRDCVSVVVMLPVLSLFYDIQSRFQEGNDLFQQAVSIWSQPAQTTDETLVAAQLQIQHAVFTTRLLYDQDVSPLYREALPILQEIREPELVLTCLQVGWLKSLNPLDADEAGDWIAKGRQLAEAKGDIWETAFALYVQGDFAQWGRAEYEEAKGLYQQSLELRQRIGDWWGQANALNSLGHSSVILGRYQEAQWFHREALRISQDVNDLHGIAWAKAQLADIARVLGHYQDAWTLNWKVYRLAMRFGNQGIAAWRLLNVGRILFFQDHFDDAMQHVQQSLLLFQRVHHRQGQARALLDIGRILFRQDQVAEARLRFQESLAQFRANRQDSGEAMVLFYLGYVHFALNEMDQAFEQMLFAFRFAYQKGVIGTILRYCYGLGELLLHTEHPSDGVRILAFVVHHLATPDYVRKRVQTILAKQERQQPAAEFQAAIEAGKRMTVEDIGHVILSMMPMRGGIAAVSQDCILGCGEENINIPIMLKN